MAGQAEIVETLLAQLLQPDTTAIQQATQELKLLVKDPNIIPALCTVLTASQNVQVRQYAAVLLRRRILKRSYWNNLLEDLRVYIKQNLLQVLMQETDKTVRNSLSQLIATVARHELSKGQWAELFDFIQQGTQSQDHAVTEVCMLVLSSVTAAATEQLKPQFIPLLQILAAALQESQTVNVKYHALRSLTNLVPYIGSEEMKGMQQLVPQILIVLEQLIQADQEKAVEGFEILEELVESEISVVVPHIKAAVEFCLKVAAKTDLEDAVRVKALSFISCLTRLKRKAILKLKLAQMLVNALFPIMCEPSTEEDEDEEFDEAEAHTAPSYAAQVMDAIALNLPPEKFIMLLMTHVEQALGSANQHHRKAAYIAMAVVSEGCADHLRTKYLQQLLQCAYKGIADPELIVRHAALFALGQFSEHLQPDISKHAAEILPLVFNYLAAASPASDKDPKGITKTYYALEMFCENLGEDIVPYLPTLMQHLLSTLGGETAAKSKELAISAIGATVSAAEDQIMPYFPQIIEHLKGFLQSGQSEDALKLQVQAIDTLAVLSRSVSKEHFLPLASECVQLGITLLSDATDPDLKRCIYGLFAALSCLLGEQMGPYLETAVRAMLDSVKSTEGITAHYAEQESTMMNLFDDEEDLEDTEEEDEAEELQGFSVENAYLDEKEDACTSLGELAENTKSAFMPYYEESFTEVHELVDDPAPSIRKGAITAICSFCCAIHYVCLENNTPQTTAVLQTSLSKSVPLILKTVQEDQDRQVAMIALEGLTTLLEKVKVAVLEVATVQQIMNCVMEVLHHKVACQDPDETDLELEEQEAEFDSMLLEHAGDVGPLVAKLIGGPAFYPYFANIAPVLLKKLKSGASVADRSFGIGSLAELVHACGPDTGPMVPHLYTAFNASMTDEDCEVRSNAVYGIGVLAGTCHEALKDQLPHILKDLVEVLGKESDRRVVDNVAAAACRLILTGQACIPVDQVLPVVMQCLPLKEDLEENKTVYECIANLYKAKPELVLQCLPQLLASTSQVLGNKQVNTETRYLLGGLLQDIQSHHPEVWQSAVSSIPAEVATSLCQFFSSMANCS